MLAGNWAEKIEIFKFHVNNSINCSIFIAVRRIHRNKNYWSLIRLYFEKMGIETFLSLKHIKEMNKTKVTRAKIESFAKEYLIEITTDELNTLAPGAH